MGIFLLQILIFRTPQSQNFITLLTIIHSMYLHSHSRFSGKLLHGKTTGLSEPGVPGMASHPQFWTDHLTLTISTMGADYADHITTCSLIFQTFLRPWGTQSVGKNSKVAGLYLGFGWCLESTTISRSSNNTSLIPGWQMKRDWQWQSEPRSESCTISVAVWIYWFRSYEGVQFDTIGY